MAKIENVEKDYWDKAEVVSKFIVPIVVALSVWAWNVQKSSNLASASMIEIAVGVLSSPEKTENGRDHLREWAALVLQNPTNPPHLSQLAADDLIKNSRQLLEIDTLSTELSGLAQALGLEINGLLRSE